MLRFLGWLWLPLALVVGFRVDLPRVSCQHHEERHLTPCCPSEQHELPREARLGASDICCSDGPMIHASGALGDSPLRWLPPVLVEVGIVQLSPELTFVSYPRPVAHPSSRGPPRRVLFSSFQI